MQKKWKKEQTLCTFTQNGTRLQLVKVIFGAGVQFRKAIEDMGHIDRYIRYEVHLNRKIISKSISEYTERKVFATYIQNIVLQLKIY